MILTISEIDIFKKEAEKKGVHVHFCDACGGQSFDVDSPTNEFKEFVVDYWDKKNMQVIFSEDGNHFVVKEKR